MPTKHDDKVVKLILSKTRPEQEIGVEKLRKLLPGSVTYDAFYAAMRYLRQEGLATMVKRLRHADGSLVTFYKTPIPASERDTIKRQTAPGRVVQNHTAPVFVTAKTFKLTEGVYTARELRPLARAVLKDLGEL